MDFDVREQERMDVFSLVKMLIFKMTGILARSNGLKKKKKSLNDGFVY